MLKSIEVWNFESHEHTLVPDFSEGLNVIFGQSQAGKTSIIRALKLAAYNTWDPKSLRVGCKNCKVRVTTDRGVVQVSKGSSGNLWEITPKGGKTLNLSGVGTAVVPQAAEIIGLSIVKLGDIDVPVNIMDQLETHFMLQGIGDQKATGSVRAQIIDEISGLSGIEGVIKAVSLDNHRDGREIKQLEKQMEEKKGQLHDEGELKAEAQILGQAEEHLTNSRDALDAAEAAENLLAESQAVKVEIGTLQTQLVALPDAKTARVHLDNAAEALDVMEQAEAIDAQSKTAKLEVARLTKSKAAIPDYVAAGKHLDKAKVALDQAIEAESLRDELARNTADIQAEEKKLSETVDTAAAEVHLDKAKEALNSLSDAESMAQSVQSAKEEVERLERRLASNEAELKGVLAEQAEALKLVTVCPLNPAHPVSEDCLKGVRTPVVEGV